MKGDCPHGIRFIPVPSFPVSRFAETPGQGRPAQKRTAIPQATLGTVEKQFLIGPEKNSPSRSQDVRG